MQTSRGYYGCGGEDKNHERYPHLLEGPHHWNHLMQTLGLLAKGHALGLGDLLAMWLEMTCLCLRYSIIFFCRDGNSFTSVPYWLHFVIRVFLPFLNVWIPFRVWTMRSTLIVSSRRLHMKNPNRKLQFAAKLQAISGSVSGYILCCFLRIVGCQSRPSHALL